MESVASDDGVSIKCIDSGVYSFNGKPCIISKGSISNGETVVRVEVGVIREHVL